MSLPAYALRKYGFVEGDSTDVQASTSSLPSVDALTDIINNFPKSNIDVSKVDSSVSKWLRNQTLSLDEYLDNTMKSVELTSDEQIFVVLNILAHITKHPSSSSSNVNVIDVLAWLNEKAPIQLIYDLYINGYLVHYNLLKALAGRFLKNFDELKFFITKTNHVPSRQYDFLGILIPGTAEAGAAKSWDFLISEGFISPNFGEEYNNHVKKKAMSTFDLPSDLAPSVYRESLNLGRLFNPDFIELDEALLPNSVSVEAKYEDIYRKTIVFLNSEEREHLELIYDQALTVIKTNDAKTSLKLLQQGFLTYGAVQPLFACLIALRLFFEQGPKAKDVFEYPPLANKFHKIMHEEIMYTAPSFMLPALIAVESNPNFDKDYSVGLTFKDFPMSEITAPVFKKILQNPYVKDNNEIIRSNLQQGKISLPKSLLGFQSYYQSPIDTFIGEWCSNNEKLLTGDIINVLLNYVEPAFLSDADLMRWWNFYNPDHDYMPVSWVRKFLEAASETPTEEILQNAGGGSVG